MILSEKAEKLILNFEKIISQNRRLGKNQEKILNEMQDEMQKLHKRIFDIALKHCVRSVIRRKPN